MQDESFFPSTLEVWLRVLFQTGLITAAVVGFGWRYVKWYIDQTLKKSVDDLDGLGRRLNATEAGLKAAETNVGTLLRGQELAEFHRLAHAERMGQLESKFEQVMKTSARTRHQANNEAQMIRERLVGIETKMEIFEELRDALIAIAKR